ncbi:predicted protein [Uncinocarpus reesii 1704]|uniref:Uncharacterized protein n=1 Tax=Uncinocarpus reesii (strain UAMH 1704) TaxID=336963 RepID=C4JIQ2_UNCRE|nr:uncharacterized protein UREG_02913 [Uncinocarpus reesii 1704]EEP78064.1 predicted protein [Uncinocarpus reesii 1704]
MPPLSKRNPLPFKPPRSVAVSDEIQPVPRANNARKKTNSSSRKRSKTQMSPEPHTVSPSRMSEPPQAPDNRSPSPVEQDLDPVRRSSIDSLSSDPEYILAEIIAPKEEEKESLETSEPDFPPKLLAAIIHRHMKRKGEKMRITKDANRLYAKYIDIFVKEAIARAIYERKDKLQTDGIQRDRTRTMIDSYLEKRELARSQVTRCPLSTELKKTPSLNIIVALCPAARINAEQDKHLGYIYGL